MWGAIASALLPAAGKLIGGLFGDDDPKPARTENRVNYKQMVADAEAAGFNPLTALRNGGAAGYSSTVHHPALASRNFIGEAIDAGIQGFLNFDPHEDRNRQAEYDLVQAQISNLNMDTRQRQRRLESPLATSVPTWTDTGLRSTRSPTKAEKVVAAVTGAPTLVEAGQATVTNPWQEHKVDPDVRDAAIAEDRYGEVIGSAIGLYTGWKDLMANYGDGLPFMPEGPWFNWGPTAKYFQKAEIPKLDQSRKPSWLRDDPHAAAR